MISAIILAAGSAKRMGQQKLLLPLNQSTILETVIEVVQNSNCFEEIIIVYSKKEVYEKTKNYKIKNIYNEKAELGQSTSVITGVKNTNAHAEAFMFFAGDQPFINLNIIKTLIKSYKENPNSIIVPQYKGEKGMPTIFSKEFRSQLLCLSGDSGGKPIIQKYKDKVIFVDFQDDKAAFDIDTLEDYNKLIGKI